MIDFYGGFPAIDPNWDPNNYDLTTLIAKIVRTMPAFSLFFSANINLGVADTSKYGIEVSIYDKTKTTSSNSRLSQLSQMLGKQLVDDDFPLEL